MLYELIQEGFGKKEDLNCSESILYGANQAYKLGLSKDCLRLSAAFGGGMGVENVCGVVTGSIMVLGYLFVKNNARGNPEIKELCKELFDRFIEELGDFDCAPLKEKYRTEEKKCYDIILKGAKILDEIVSIERQKRSQQSMG